VTVPAVVIVLSLEASRRIRVEAEREGDEARLADWIAANPRLVALYRGAVAAATEMGRAA
jgi:hypothetical protein